MRRHSASKPALVVCLAMAAFAVVAQDQRPPVFRGGVTFVNVDAYPRRDGRLVEGLRAEDFQILEDGKPQKVETFEFIRSEPNTPDADRRDPNTQEEGDRLAADPRNRVFVVYLDLYHTTFVGAHDTRRPLLDFLGRTIGATDLFGVITPEVPVRQLVFGRRLETLESELTKYFDWGLEDQPILPRTPAEQRLWASGCDVGLIRAMREDEMATSLEELMVRLSAIRDERKNLVLISEGWVPRGPRPAQQGSGKGNIPPIGVDPRGRLGVGPSRPGQIDESMCDREASRLASIDYERRFRDLLQLANRSNVSFYPVDVGGLKTRAIPASRSGTPSVEQILATQNLAQGRVDTLRTLASNTDGRAIVDTNGLGDGFRKIADELSAYYLLGYSSTNTNQDGRYRRIEVKINQPKISVAARKGYLAPSAEALAVAAAAAATAVVAPVGVTDDLARLSRLRADADLFSYGISSRGGLEVVTEISGREVGLGHWTKGADVQVSATRAGAASVTSTGRIDAGARGTLVHVALPAGDAGSWRITVRLSGPDGTLDDRFDIEPSVDGLVGAPLCFRGTASARIALRPVADFQFRRTERVHVEWPVLKALDQRTARVLDRKGQPLALSATVTETSRDEHPILAVDVSLAPLNEGDYVIELTTGQGARTERQLMAFRVVK